MQSSRVSLAAAAGGKPVTGAWDALKNKFKSKFMIGDTHEHYVPPRAGFQNRDSKYTDLDTAHYRVPAPGSQPEPNVPRGYPETEFDISLAKRPGYKLSSGAGVTPVEDRFKQYEQIPQLNSRGQRMLPRHIPQPSWHFNRDQIKRARRLYLETGLHAIGVPNFGLQRTTYYPVKKHQTREDWENVEVIRDVRIPRL